LQQLEAIGAREHTVLLLSIVEKLLKSAVSIRLDGRSSGSKKHLQDIIAGNDAGLAGKDIGGTHVD